VASSDGFQLLERPPTVLEYRRLRRAVGWAEVPDEGLAAALAGALYSCVVVHNGDAVACGRVVGDSALYFYVQDVMVLPEFHGRGLDAQVMGAVVQYLEGVALPGAFVGLTAAQDIDGFYERFGFHRRPDDRSGLFRVW